MTIILKMEHMLQHYQSYSIVPTLRFESMNMTQYVQDLSLACCVQLKEIV